MWATRGLILDKTKHSTYLKEKLNIFNIAKNKIKKIDTTFLFVQ